MKHLLTILVLFLVSGLGAEAQGKQKGASKRWITGVVTAKTGQPISGVRVYSTAAPVCCSYRKDDPTTNDKGGFRLYTRGRVIRFWKELYEPKALIVGRKTSTVNVRMEPAANDLKLAPCPGPRSDEKQIGFRRIKFVVPTRGVEVQGGTWDVDYVRYAIRPEKGAVSRLELWFGSYAISPDPDDKEFLNSVDFTQRNVLTPDSRAEGLDSRGRSRTGRTWRQTAVQGTGGAIYMETPLEEARLYDQIIDSICEAPIHRWIVTCKEVAKTGRTQMRNSHCKNLRHLYHRHDSIAVEAEGENHRDRFLFERHPRGVSGNNEGICGSQLSRTSAPSFFNRGGRTFLTK